jgi:transcriptional regulator with XRE-family HTH domain
MSLREYLDEKRMTYREFAEKLGIHLQSLKNIAYGKKKPSLELALKIEELTGITPRELMSAFVETPKLKRKSLKKDIKKDG